jgi:hypothetical protein
MRTSVRVGLLAIAIAIAAAAAVRGARAHREHELTESLAKLRGDARMVEGCRAGSPGVARLPAPVRRYLELAIPRDQPAARWITLRQHGELRTAPDSARWMKFDALHSVSPGAFGFLWNAQVSAAPLVRLRVVDSLENGHGAGQVLLFSALRVGHDEGTPEMDAGSLHRFLAEAVWYPWALCPSGQLSWAPADDHRAVATLSVGRTTVSLVFTFGPGGEVTSIYTPGRWGSFDGGYAKVAWEGHFSRYERRNGVLLPLYGEVGWYDKRKLALVWKGSVDDVKFD